MENSKLDTYVVDVRASLRKNKIVVIGAVALAVLSIGVSSVIVMNGANAASENIRIIDRIGYSYTSELMDPHQAIELQSRAFLLNFIKLSYMFDANNIEANLNRAVLLGDNTVKGYIQMHSEPNELYHAIKGLGRVASVDESQVLKNLVFGGNNSFQTSFVQTVRAGTQATMYRITVAGTLARITPKGIDNPNGMFVNNFVENYEKLQGLGTE